MMMAEMGHHAFRTFTTALHPLRVTGYHGNLKVGALAAAAAFTDVLTPLCRLCSPSVPAPPACDGVYREFVQTAWEDIERFKEQKNKDLHEALISYAVMQISMCKKVFWPSDLLPCAPSLNASWLKSSFYQLFRCLHFLRESRCGPTRRSVSTKCEPVSTKPSGHSHHGP